MASDNELSDQQIEQLLRNAETRLSSAGEQGTVKAQVASNTLERPLGPRYGYHDTESFPESFIDISYTAFRNWI